ncbi:MAG: peptidase M23 [Bacteroidetes bacterium HGW-Bacteroidetes-10]|nr:MAG: peptidase M23 [Bacteroidetes bacterium HGW-Bacteroidetes-10]
MSNNKRYKFNPETLAYEIHKISVKARFSKGFIIFLVSIAVSFGYYFIYTEYFGLETPKMLSIRSKNTELANRLSLLERRFEAANRTLISLQIRDNYVYRPIFGMEEISQEVRNAGFGGVNRYSYLETVDRSGILTNTVMSIDQLYKKAFIQSRSFDEVSQLAKNADEMSLCVPAIPPVNVASRKIRFSSTFGYRPDPFNGAYRMHTGIDLSGPANEPIYATGNGKVSEIGYDFFGYGNYIIVDHGFGYKTRYAHLKTAHVTMGRKVQRGEHIANMGNTGRSKGNHLHYEVIYRNRPVNPLNYYNRDIASEEFLALVEPKSQPKG